jgi:ketosteroid isomerase-like protein
MMNTIVRSIARTGLIVIVLGFVASQSVALALTQILPEAVIEADQQSLAELIGTFDRAQEAIRARDIDALMGLYAPNYQYHGLRRGDIRKIWADLFARYDLIANMHTFSAIKVVSSGNQTTAEITCTGAVWANSRETKQRIPIDSWHQEVHRLVKEKDGWRIVGNLGGDQTIRQFGTAPHPLF